MTTMIQGSQPTPTEDASGVFAVALILILVLGIALGIAYMNGAFQTQPPTVIENTRVETTKEKENIVPAPVPVEPKD